MALNTKHYEKDHDINDLIRQIALAVQGIKFGSVEIVIHDSKIVQIERKEKLRFDGKLGR